MRSKILDSLAWHQRGWYEQRDQRNRMILKSRQIGATWYFAREALLGALRTDIDHSYQRNQIFLSASRKQALQFRNFIREAAEEVDVELKGGDQITLSNGAQLHFLGTSAATAQSYTGHLRFDEFFWTGDRWNAKRPKAQRVDFDVSWKKTHSGLLYPDKTWRQIVTIQDAVNNGWMHTIIDEIRDENSPDEFENLYMCEFVKDGESAFNLSQLLACGVDGYDDWPDWKPFAGRPMGQREVWLGYDANGGSGNGDAGALSVTVPPLVAGGRFRTVELKQLRGLEFEQQAAVIKEAAERYNVI